MEEQAAQTPNRLMSELASVMRATAETSRQATLEQCRTDSKAYGERLSALLEEGATALRKTCEDDVTTIEGQSKASIERVRTEADRRITRRREILEQEMLEYRAAVDHELERVQESVAAFEREIAQFFERLEGSDPATFATMASQAPDPPALRQLDLDALGSEIRGKHEGARAAVASVQPGGDADAGEGEELPPGWWLDSPARLAAEAEAATPEKGKS